MSDSLAATMLESQIQEASSPSGLFTLPCGYLDDDGTLHTDVHLREFTGEEEDLLTAKTLNSYAKMNAFLSACIVRIGTIDNAMEIQRIVPKLLIGDRTFLFFSIRRTTHGDLFPFRRECETCEDFVVVPFNLGFLSTTVMPEPTRRIYSVKLPSGKEAKFKCLAGEDEQERDRLKNAMPPLSLALFLRVTELEGAIPSVTDLKRLSGRDRDKLRTCFAESDGGVETTVRLGCPQCGNKLTEMDIDPGQPSFFFPGEMQAIWKRRSSS